MASTINAQTTPFAAIIQSADATGDLALQTANVTAVTINPSQNVGIGTTSPTTKLDVLGFGDDQIRIRSGSDAALIFSETTANKNWKLKPSAGDFYWQYSATAYNSGYASLMVLNSSGNLGLGVTPSAWYSTGYSALQVRGSSIYSTSGNDTNLISNAFLSTSPAWTYISTAAASRYEQVSGQHRWHIAPSGTAGNAITFTQAMTLDASGNLGVGITSPTVSSGYTGLHINNASTGAQLHLTGGGSGTTSFDGSMFTHIGTELYITNFEAGPTIFFNNLEERMRLTSVGDLGIGNSNPGVKLDVAGTIRSSSATVTSASTITPVGSVGDLWGRR